MRLKNKLSGLVVLLMAAVVFTIGVMVVWSEKTLLTSEQERHQTDLVNHLAKVYEESLFQNELLFFNYIKNLETERGFVAAYFVGNDGRIQIHSDPTKIGRPMEETEGTSSLIDLNRPAHFGQSQVGFVHLQLNKTTIDRFIHDSLTGVIIRMGWISLMALILGLLGAFWLARTIVAPIEKVVYGMRDVAEGKLDPVPELDRKDELGWMTKELNVTIQKLKELDEMKREFIASVTHEFRSPLTAIESFLSLLMRGTYGTVTNEQKESLLTIKNNTIRLTSFVDDLLTTAKLEAKKIDVVRLDFDLREAATGAAKLFSSLAQDHHLTLNVDLPKEPIRINSDRTKIDQILANLVSNAIKFTKAGSVTIRVAKKMDRAELSVIDTGVGISEQDKKLIFEKFYRAGSTATATKGTGLGLSIVKAYAELLGANLSVADNPSGGSHFSLVF